MEVTFEITEGQLEKILNNLSIDEAKRAAALLRKKIDDHNRANLDMPLKDLGLSERTLKALTLGKITMLRQLLEYSLDDLRHFKNIGQKSLKEMEEHVFSIYAKK